MTIRRLMLVLALLLLFSVGLASAQSSPNFVMQRHALYSASSAESDSFGVTGIIGQPAVASAESPSFGTRSGFLHPGNRGASFTHKVWLPTVTKGSP